MNYHGYEFQDRYTGFTIFGEKPKEVIGSALVFLGIVALFVGGIIVSAPVK